MKRIFTLLLAAVLVLSLAACGQGSTPQSSQPGSSGAAPAPVEKTVAIMTPYLSSVTTNQMVEMIQQKLLAGAGDIKVNVSVVDTKGDFAQLASRIEDTVSAKADAIVLVSADPNQVATQLQMAFDAGIPVFGCDSGFIEGMTVNASSDNYAMGEQITKYLFDELMGGKGTVIALSHRPHPGVVKRSEAFDALLADYPDIKVITEQHVEVPNPIDNARKTVESLLLANSAQDSVTAIWCAWDEPAIGATQALQDAGRGEVLVVGVDGNEQAVELINGDTNLKATLSQNFEGMSEIIANDILAMFGGAEIEKGEKYAPANLITK